MPDIAIARARGNQDFHSVQGVRPIILKVMRQLLPGQQHAFGRRYRLPWLAIEHQPLLRLTRVARDVGPVGFGCNGDFHGAAPVPVILKCDSDGASDGIGRSRAVGQREIFMMDT